MADIEYLKTNFAFMTNKELAKELGLSVSRIKKLASELGLRKAPEQISNCHKKQHRKVINGLMPEDFSRTLSGGFVCVVGSVTIHRMHVSTP